MIQPNVLAHNIHNVSVVVETYIVGTNEYVFRHITCLIC